LAPSHPAASAANQAELFTMRARSAVAARDYDELPAQSCRERHEALQDRRAMGKIVAMI
jgi:hypothetical protein